MYFKKKEREKRISTSRYPKDNEGYGGLLPPGGLQAGADMSICTCPCPGGMDGVGGKVGLCRGGGLPVGPGGGESGEAPVHISHPGIHDVALRFCPSSGSGTSVP